MRSCGSETAVADVALAARLVIMEANRLCYVHKFLGRHGTEWKAVLSPLNATPLRSADYGPSCSTCAIFRHAVEEK